MKRIAMIILIMGCFLSLNAERGESDGEFGIRNLEWQWGVDVREGYAFPSFRDDVLRDELDMRDASENRLGTAVNFQWGFRLKKEPVSLGESEARFKGAADWGADCSNANQGLGVGAYLFNHLRSIGVPVSVYAFQGAPICRLGRGATLDYSWNFGASFGWKPSDGRVASSDLIVGSRVNAYINLGLGVRWGIGRGMALIAGLDLTHFSNGNTSFPNPGVNIFGVRVGIEGGFHTDSCNGERGYGSGCGEREDEGKIERKEGKEKKGRKAIAVSYDLTGYGAWRRRVYRGGEKPVVLDGKYGIAGVMFAPMWDVKRWFRTGVSLDCQWDGSSDLKHYWEGGSTAEDIRFGKVPFFSQVSVGLSARAELVMPIFSVNIGIGYNFIGPEEARASYQMANLKVRLTERFFLNIGYQLQNFQKQNNLMLGCGWKF